MALLTETQKRHIYNWTAHAHLRIRPRVLAPAPAPPRPKLIPLPEIYGRAAELIEIYGWRRGVEGTYSIGFCALGAIRTAVNELSAGNSSVARYNFDRAIRTADKVVRRRTSCSGVVHYNDTRFLFGKREVLGMLRALEANTT